MRRLTAVLFASAALFLTHANVKAQSSKYPDPDLPPGCRIVKQQPDVAKGETRRWQIFNKAGQLSQVWLDYKDGRQRSEHYSGGAIKSSYETDHSTFARYSQFNGAGVLVKEENSDGNGKPVATYLNAEELPNEITITMAEPLRFFSSKNNLFVALADRTVDGGAGDVLSWSVAGVKPPDGFRDAGGYKAARQGAAEVSVAAKGANITKLTVIVKDSGAKSGVWGEVRIGPLFGNPPNIPGKPVRNSKEVPGAVIVAKDKATGKEVARTKSDKDGRYSLALPPGTYVVTPVFPGKLQGGLPISESSEVEVKKDKWSERTLSFNTLRQ